MVDNKRITFFLKQFNCHFVIFWNKIDVEKLLLKQRRQNVVEMTARKNIEIHIENGIGISYRAWSV